MIDIWARNENGELHFVDEIESRVSSPMDFELKRDLFDIFPTVEPLGGKTIMDQFEDVRNETIEKMKVVEKLEKEVGRMTKLIKRWDDVCRHKNR